MKETTVLYGRVPELPPGHRPTRVYTVVVSAARRVTGTLGYWEASATVRERLDLERSASCHTPEGARLDAARGAVSAVYRGIGYDLYAVDAGPVDALPGILINVIYESQET